MNRIICNRFLNSAKIKPVWLSISFFIIYFFICNLQSSLYLFAQQPTQEWVRRFSGSGYASGISVKLDSAGNVYVLLKLYTDSTFNDFGILKYSNSGTLLWNRYYNSPGNLSDSPQAFDVNAAGDIYVTGNSGINFSNQITTVKYNTSGNLQWVKTYPSGTSDLILDKFGNVIVIGGDLVIKYNPIGDTLWTRRLIITSHGNWALKAATDDSANIYTTGYYEPDTLQSNYITAKYDQNGNLKWYVTYDNPQHLSDISYEITIDSNRNVYVVGENGVPFPGNANNTLLKINSLGSTQWARIYKGIGGNSLCSFPTGLASTPDGSSIYYITSCIRQGGTDFITLKYNTFGDTVWIRQFMETTDIGIQNNPSALKLDRFFNVYLSGAVENPTSGYDYAIIKYLPNGTQQWIATYNGPLSNSFDYTSDLCLDNNLNVYTTGISSRYNGPPDILWDAATIKYSQPIGIISNQNGLPVNYKLNQNYSNPFNSSTVITYELPKKSNISLKMYNAEGQLIKVLVNSSQQSGYYSVIVNMNEFASGVYFYTLLSDNSLIDTKKFILIK